MDELLWHLEGVSVGPPCARRLDGVSVDIRQGTTAVLGPSGAGKSTLLNLLVGYEAVGSGTVKSSVDAGGHALPVYWAPQGGGLWPHLTVREHLATVLPEGAPESRAMDLLRALDVADRAGARPEELSGGERTRVAVARALAADAAVLVLDEPLASVDVAGAGRCWDVIREDVAASGASLVFATHSSEAVLAEARRVICLRAGRLTHEGDVQALYWSPRSREEAECLGEVNWLEPDEACLWLHGEAPLPRCVRPEQLVVTRDPAGPLSVVSSRFMGSIAELELLHEETGQQRRFTHRPASDGLPSGVRVALSVLTCLLLLVLGGCGGSDARELVVSGVRSWSLPPEGPTLPAPRGLAVGKDGEVFVLDTAGRVLVFGGDGALRRRWRMPDVEEGNPEGACVLQDGRLAVADTHYHRVVVFEPDGRLVRMFGSLGTGPGQFLYPVAVVQDPKGNLYVCEYGDNDRVQKFAPDGAFMLAFGSFGAGAEQFQRPAGMVWHDGKILVADAINNRIQVFTDEGKHVGVLGAGAAGLSFHFPYDIAIDGDGVLFVIEYGAGRLARVSLDGRLLGRYGATGKGEGQFHTPWGVAVASPRRVWVADTGNRRLVELKL